MLVLQRHTLTLCALSRDAQSDLRRAAGIAENVPVSMDNNPVWRHVSLFTATGNLVDVDQVSMLSKNVSGLLDTCRILAGYLQDGRSGSPIDR